MARTTRHIGFCPVCERDIKVRDDVLVHHGYQRPGHGFIVGDCYGVHRPPHELSDETALGYLVDVIQPEVARTERRLADVRRKGYTYERVWVRGDWNQRGHYEQREVRPEDVSTERYAKLVRDEEAAIKARLSALSAEQRRIEELVRSWRLQPLRTVQEEQALALGEREKKQQAVRSRKEDKAAELVAKYQKRIDSAVRNQNQAVLAEIHVGARQKIRDLLPELDERDVLALLDRADVWEAFGLYDPRDGYLVEERVLTRGGWFARTGAVHDKLEAMSSTRHGYGDESPWPAALGAPKKRRR